MGTDTEHILGQLLGNGRSASALMAQGSILDGAKDTNGVNTEMAVETLVLGINKSLEEIRSNLFILNRGTVFTEELANKLTVSTVNLRSLAGLRIKDAGEITG